MSPSSARGRYHRLDLAGGQCWGLCLQAVLDGSRCPACAGMLKLPHRWRGWEKGSARSLSPLATRSMTARTPDFMADAANAAADVMVVLPGLPGSAESQGFDRTTMDLCLRISCGCSTPSREPTRASSSSSTGLGVIVRDVVLHTSAVVEAVPLHPQAAAFADHYGFVIHVLATYCPAGKGRVE